MVDTIPQPIVEPTSLDDARFVILGGASDAGIYTVEE